MKRNIALTLLIIGSIAGYASGIYGVTHGQQCKQGSCQHSRWHDSATDAVEVK